MAKAQIKIIKEFQRKENNKTDWSMISSSFFSLLAFPCSSLLKPLKFCLKKRPLLYSTSPSFIPLIKTKNNSLKIANSGSEPTYCGPQWIYCGPQWVEAVNRLRRKIWRGYCGPQWVLLRAAMSVLEWKCCAGEVIAGRNKVIADRNKGPGNAVLKMVLSELVAARNKLIAVRNKCEIYSIFVLSCSRSPVLLR